MTHLSILMTKRVAENAPRTSFAYSQRSRTFSAARFTDMRMLNLADRQASVSFRYPARPETLTLKNFELKIRSGTTVALVGASGCGKSTCIQMIERFYDVEPARFSIHPHI